MSQRAGSHSGSASQSNNARAAVAVAAGVVVGCGLGCLAWSGGRGAESKTPSSSPRPSSTRSRSRASAASSAAAAPPARRRRHLPAYLLEEQLARNRAFFGDAGQDRVMAARVAVFGAAGAGSHCVHMLVRSGVQHLTVVDDAVIGHGAGRRPGSCRGRPVDTLTTNALARAKDAGRPCADVLKQYCEAFSNAEMAIVDVGPTADGDDAFVRAVERVLGVELTTSSSSSSAAAAAGVSVAEAGPQTPDYVVDCLDGTTQLRRKRTLLRACVARGVRVVSLLTTQGRVDPTRVRAEPLGDVRGDPAGLLLQKALLADFYERGPGPKAPPAAAAAGQVTAAAGGGGRGAKEAVVKSADIAPVTAGGHGGGGGKGGKGGGGGGGGMGKKARSARGGRRSSGAHGRRGAGGGAGASGAPERHAAFGLIDAVTSAESWRGGGDGGGGGGEDGAMACVFGMALASKCLCDLAERPLVDPLPTTGLAPGTLKQLTKSLSKSEKRRRAGRLGPDVERDVEFAAAALFNVGSTVDHRVRFNGKNLECRRLDDGADVDFLNIGLLPKEAPAATATTTAAADAAAGTAAAAAAAAATAAAVVVDPLFEQRVRQLRAMAVQLR